MLRPDYKKTLLFFFFFKCGVYNSTVENTATTSSPTPAVPDPSQSTYPQGGTFFGCKTIFWNLI